MMNWVVVMAGALCGATFRYFFQTQFDRSYFPWGTLAVNLLGCLAVGFLSQWPKLNTELFRPFIFIGLLGAFTTFSAFALQVVKLMEQKAYLLACSYWWISSLGCVICCWVGIRLASVLSEKIL